jgi:peptidoglycan/LPS O-acetylase OafA/YrhL
MKFFNLGNTGNRVFGLDLLRFVAIFMVLLGHSKMLLPQHLKPIFDQILLDGVAIFFVLSGFLIGGILIKQVEREAPSIGGLTHFWKRRWMRTLPAYLVVLCFLLIYTLLFVPKNIPSDWWKYLLFSQNLINERNEFFAESWSLSIEEWFYLTIPVILFGALYIFKARVRTTVAMVCLVVLSAITLYRYETYHAFGFHNQVAKTEAKTMTRSNADSSEVMYRITLNNVSDKDVNDVVSDALTDWKWVHTAAGSQQFAISGDMNGTLSSKDKDRILPFQGELITERIGKTICLSFIFHFDQKGLDTSKLKYVKQKIVETMTHAYIPPFKKYIETHLEYQVLPRLDAILFGVIGAFFAFYFPVMWNHRIRILLAISGAIMLFYTKQNMGRSYEEYAIVWFPLFKSLGVLMMLPFLANWKKGFGHFTSWVTFFSIISYSMYLLNLNVVTNVLIKNVINGNWVGKPWASLTPLEQFYNSPDKYYVGRHIVTQYWVVDYCLFWGLTIGLSFLLYKLVEVPFMNLRDRSKKFGANSAGHS